MWCRILCAGLLMAGLSLGTTRGYAQGAKGPEDVSMETCDGVKLRGVLYPAAASKGRSGAVVILLHAYQKDSLKGDWEGLAKKLSAEGYHVLRFDFRFHGTKVMDVNPNQFWNHSLNMAHVTGGNAAKKKTELTFKDIKTNSRRAYHPMLANDIMAARTFLDQLSDTSRVNTSNVYLIGAGDSAALGFLYMAAEWHREQKVPTALISPPSFVSGNRDTVGGTPAAGRDLNAAIWLTPAVYGNIDREATKRLVSQYATSLRTETPMLFLYGEKDSAGKASTKFFFDDVLVANPKAGKSLKPLPLTKIDEIKNSSLSGADLLGKGLGTEEKIVEYLNFVEKERKLKPPVSGRGYNKPLEILYGTFGITVQQ